MKNMLLMRYRAIAASLYEYVRTRGTMYSRFFSFASGQVRPTENGSGLSITELYQIANGIPESVDDTMMYCITVSDDRGLIRSQYPEDLLMLLLSKPTSIASGHSDDILFSKGDYLWGSKELGQVYTQYIEELIMRSLTESPMIASGHSDDILFGLGKHLNNSDDRGLGQTQYVEDLILQSLTRSITRGSGYMYDILFGQSLEFIEMDDRCLGRVASAERANSHVIIEMDDRGLGRIATVERAIGKSIIRLLHKAAWSSDIVFGRGLGTIETDVLGLGRIASAERTIGQSVTKFLHKAAWSSDNIGFGRGLDTTEIVSELQLGLSDIIYPAGTEICRLLNTIASPSDLNLLNGRGLMSAKLVGNSSISIEVPEETQMIFVKTLDNNVVSGVSQDVDSISANVNGNMTSNAGGVLMDTNDEFGERVNTSGTSVNYMISIAGGKLVDISNKSNELIRTSGTSFSRMTSIAGGKLSELLNYFAYTKDDTEGTITLHSVLYDKIYEDTGTYNVMIPDKIGGYSVIIDNES